MVSRIGSFANQQLILDATLRTQSQLAETRLQAATGKKSQIFSGIAQDSSRLVNLKNEVAKADQYIENIATTEKRLTLMNLSLETIDEIAREMRSITVNSLNGEAADTNNLTEVATQFLEQTVELLNQRDDSRYLFAGGKTDTKPVDLANGVYTAPAPPPFDAVVDTGYYEGDSTTQQVRIDDGVTIQYGITADQSAFEKVIRALDNIAQTTFSVPITPAEKQVLNDAITLLTEATENNGAQKTIGGFATDVALDLRTIDIQKDRHTEFINFATNSIADIENVDTAETLSLLNFQQVQLEASFQIVARLGQLSLSNFLR
jgi:flagellar hook-associated protein 3 FlgL